MQEQTLLRQLNHGDRDAFWELCERHRPYLRHLCLNDLDDHDSAEDAIQDAIIKAWFLWDNVGEIKNFKAWLAEVTHNVCWNAQKKRAYQEQSLVQDTNSTTNDLVVSSNTLNPESAAPGAECPDESGCLLHLIDGLPPRLRTLFVL